MYIAVSLNTMWVKVAVAILLVLTICVCYDRHLSRKAHRAATKSAGGNDKHARKALNVLKKKPYLTRGERILKTELIQYNMLENDIAHAANSDPDQIAELLHEYTNIVANTDVPLDVRDRANELHAAVVTITTPAPLREQAEILAAVNNNAAAKAATSTTNSIKASNPRTRLQRIHAAIRQHASVPSDRQNVHDSFVTADMRKTLDKLRADGGPVDVNAALLQINAQFHNNPIVLRVVSRINNPNQVSSYGITEPEILALVWRRCNTGANKKGKIDALRQALEDCVENGNIVCTTGRCARVLGALAGIDDDFGGATTVAIWRKEILDECAKIVAAECEKPPQEHTRGAELYYMGSAESDEDKKVVTDFVKHLHAKLDSYIDKMVGERDPPPNQSTVDQLRAYAYAYIA